MTSHAEKGAHLMVPLGWPDSSPVVWKPPDKAEGGMVRGPGLRPGARGTQGEARPSSGKAPQGPTAGVGQHDLLSPRLWVLKASPCRGVEGHGRLELWQNKKF